MELKNLTLQYFKAFSRKSPKDLLEMFDPQVSLRDWEISAEGRNDVIAANEGIFNSVSAINVEPIALYQEGNTVVAELEILVNYQDRIKVVDVITFKNDKIVSIRAYKG